MFLLIKSDLCPDKKFCAYFLPLHLKLQHIPVEKRYCHMQDGTRDENDWRLFGWLDLLALRFTHPLSLSLA